MKTDVDTCLKDIADWFVKNRREITPSDIQPILQKHCESEKEAEKFLLFLETEPGQLRFKTLLREREGQEPTDLKVKGAGYLKETEIPKTRVSSLGFIELELPVARAVEALVEENPWSSGFHGALNQRWTIVFKGKISDRAVKAAEAAGLEVSYREAPVGSGQILTDVSLPGVGVSEIEKATEVFNRFAELYEGKPSYLKEPIKERAGRCYELAWRHITEQNEGTLIHGQVWSPKLGKMIDHAWVETETGFIYEPESDSYYPKDWLYKTYKIKEFNTYTPDQARIMSVRTNKYGPWTEAERKAFLKPSYLKEATVLETECQLISPKYYDILTWLNVPVPDYSFAIEPEVKERKIDEVLEKLKDGVSRIHESAVFREFLLTMAKFHEYSIGNQILIMLQRKDATRVAGIKTWNELGRYVKRGEKGIAILAPCLPPKAEERWVRGRAEWVIRKVPPEEREFGIFSVRNEDGVLVMPPVLVETFRTKWEAERRLREWGAEKAEEITIPTYFKVVYVFDVAQTEGKPLPEIAVPVLSGAFSKELYDKLMALASKQSLTVSFEPRLELGPEIKGTLLGKTIWVKPDEPEGQRLKTLAHEEAHYFTEAVYFIPRAEAEVIAESVAFVVGAHFGFDSGIRSFPYVALWAKEKKVLEQNLASIRRISGRMIEELG